jgi:LmeA-like phospholipid-binding
MRLVKILLVFVVVIGGLFVAADRVAVKLAEDEAASQAQRNQGMAARPTVSIKGFPFLTQVLAKKLDEVEVTADGVQAGVPGQSLRIDRFDADLKGVRLKDDFSSAVADTATGSSHITYADLTKAAPDGVTVGYGGQGSDGQERVKITVSATLPIVGTVKRSLVSAISVSGDSVRLRAVSISGLGSVAGLEDLIRQKIDFSRKLVGLPQGIRLNSIQTNADGITVSATGTQVALTQ